MPLNDAIILPIIQVLPDECVRLRSEVFIDFRHVEVVDEVDEALHADRAVVPTRLALERLLQNLLQEVGARVEVEGHVTY